MNGFGKKLNESFNNYFKKLNESNFEEFDNMTKEPVLEFPSGEYFYVDVDKENNLIFAGSATNNGIIREFEIEYDFDDTLDGNLSRLYDTIIEERPELLDEEPMDESLEDLKDYPGAKKIDTIKGIAIDTDRVQSEEAEDKYGFYQGDIIFGDEHLEVGEEYTIDVYEIPEEDWDKEGTGFGIGKDNPYFMVLKNKIDSKINEGHFEDFIKKKVVKLFNQEINDSDIEHKIDDDGYGFTIIRSNGKILTYDATTGKFNYNKNEKNESLKESLGATDLVRDLYSKFNEIDLIDERDLGENVGLIYDISKLKDKNKFKEYIKEYKIKPSKNNPNKIMIIVKEDEEDIDESYNKKQLIAAVKDAYGFTTKEANNWIKNADEASKEEIVKGFKSSSARSFLTDSLKEDLDKYQKHPDRYNIKLSKLKDTVEDYFKTTNGDATIILNGEYYNIIDESLKEDVDKSSFKSDVYNALADVMFKYHLKGNDPTPEELSEALEWFELHFFEQGYDE